MILVTLGTQDKSFTRLLEAIDKAIDDKVINEKVVVQAGHTKYETRNMTIFDYMDSKEFKSLFKQCRLLITHGGVGSIINGLKEHKVVIAAPRLSKYKEHVNDHQLEIINEFAKHGYIIPLKDFSNFKKVLKKAETFIPKEYDSNTDKFVSLIESIIEF